MLIGGIALGLILGFVAGGKLNNLLSIRLRLVQVTFFGLFLRVATQIAIENNNAPIEALRGPLFLIAFIAILAGLWANREHPGLSLAFVGVLLNTIAVAVNGGHMPVWIPAFEAAGFPPGTPLGPFHFPLPGTDSAEFLLKAGPLGDILPIPAAMRSWPSVLRSSSSRARSDRPWKSMRRPGPRFVAASRRSPRGASAPSREPRSWPPVAAWVAQRSSEDRRRPSRSRASRRFSSAFGATRMSGWPSTGPLPRCGLAS